MILLVHSYDTNLDVYFSVFRNISLSTLKRKKPCHTLKVYCRIIKKNPKEIARVAREVLEVVQMLAQAVYILIGYQSCGINN